MLSSSSPSAYFCVKGCLERCKHWRGVGSFPILGPRAGKVLGFRVGTNFLGLRVGFKNFWSSSCKTRDSCLFSAQWSKGTKLRWDLRKCKDPIYIKHGSTLEMGMRLRILWFPHFSLQTTLPLSPALLCPPTRRAGVSREEQESMPTSRAHTQGDLFCLGLQLTKNICFYIFPL